MYQSMNSYYPYNQQMYQPQQAYQVPIQQQQSIASLSGRVVNSFEELTVNDIPMNGSAAYFPKSDMSEIECRQWRNDGTISKIVFKPIVNSNTNTSTDKEEKSLESAFNEFVGTFNDRLDKLEKMIKPVRTKKEGEEA